MAFSRINYEVVETKLSDHGTAGLRNFFDQIARLTANGTREFAKNHEIYLTYATQIEGVNLPDALLDNHPDLMTVVFQHQVKDLRVDDTKVAVEMKFGGVPYYLTIPYTAMGLIRDTKTGLVIVQTEPNKYVLGTLGDDEEGPNGPPPAPRNRRGPGNGPA